MRVLVDTSIWIDHLQQGDPALRELLEQNLVVVHPFVLGELACGQMRNRAEILNLLSDLPVATRAEDAEVLEFISRQRLYGKGLALVDIHLLASCCIDSLPLWTRDKRLMAAGKSTGGSRACAKGWLMHPSCPLEFLGW